MSRDRPELSPETRHHPGHFLVATTTAGRRRPGTGTPREGDRRLSRQADCSVPDNDALGSSVDRCRRDDAVEARIALEPSPTPRDRSLDTKTTVDTLSLQLKYQQEIEKFGASSSSGESAKLLRYMSRRGGAILWLFLTASIFAIPAVSPNVRQLDTGAPEPISGSKTSLDAAGAEMALPTSRLSGATWLDGRRNEQRPYPRHSTLVALVLAVASLLILEKVCSSRGWHARFLVTGRAVSSRAPPGSAFA